MGRRVFVGSMVAALPLVASTRVRLGAQAGAGAAAHAHPDKAVKDPVLEHLARQLATVHNAMRREPRGEHLRAFAAHMRTLDVYGRQIGLDATVKAQMAALVERQGRYNVLYLEPDRDRLRSELKAYGAQPDERTLNAAISLDYAARVAVLDSTLQSGFSARWERLAGTLERLAPEADRRLGNVVRVSRQVDMDYWKGFCKQLLSEFEEVKFMTMLFCAASAVPFVGIAFAPMCITHTLAMTMLGFVYGVYCWNVGVNEP